MLVAYLVGESVPPGYVSLIFVFVFLLSSVNLMVIGLLGVYVSRIYDEVRGRPTYVLGRTRLRDDLPKEGDRAIAREPRACASCGQLLDLAADHAMRHDGFDLVRCARCGLLMRASLPAEAELTEIYAQDYFADSEHRATDGYADYLGDMDHHRRAARRRLHLLDRVGARRGRLLDVGCAAGFFVDEAASAGWKAEGVDVAASMISWGRSRLDASIRVGSLHSVQEPDSFSAVTMWDYLEHSLDPYEDLEMSDELLSNDGVVAISTGDAGSVAARLSCALRWHSADSPAPQFLLQRAQPLTPLLERCGFQAVWIGHPASRYSIVHLTYKLDRAVHLGFTRKLLTAVSSLRTGTRRVFP